MDIIISDDELEIITEKMAEGAHEAWLKKRAEEKGWHHPKDCPVLHSTKKLRFPEVESGCSLCHQCMVPYEEVPEKDKELARAYPEIFIKALDQLGYKIVKEDDLISNRL